MGTGAGESFAGFVDVRCVCGKLHTLMRDEVLEGLTISRWKCGGCKRRFVVACTPGSGSAPESYWPMFLDGMPASGETRQEGRTTESAPAMEPEQLHFQCQCGCRLVGKRPMYGRPTRCPKCKLTIVVRVGYAPEDGRPVPLLDYPDNS